MGWREQPACSPKASWGPTRIIIYQEKALLGLHHLPCETSVFTVVPYCVLWIWVVQAVLLDAAMCCVPLGYMVPWEGMLFQFLGSPLPLLCSGKWLSFSSLVQQNVFLQVDPLTLPADSLGVSVCVRISTQIPHSSCTVFFSSKW